MLTIRKTNQGRYRSEYSRLQRQTQGLKTNQGSVPAQNSSSNVLAPDPTKYPVHLADTEDDRVHVTCTLLGGEDYRVGRLDEMDACVLKFLTSVAHGGRYKVDQVLVEICFSEHGPDDDNSDRVLTILRQPSPKAPICGDPRQEHIVRRGMFNPTLQIPGGGGELGGYERTYETDYVRSWTYSCWWSVDKHDRYTRVNWDWRADMGDPGVSQVGPLYAGVVLGHAGRAFWVGCRVELKLSRPFYKRFRGGPVSDNNNYIFRKVPVRAMSTNLQTAASGLDEEICQHMSPRSQLSTNI
jgi:hypothetical protein